jgi:xylulokinase
MKEVTKTKDNSLYFLPYLTGERSPINDPHAFGAFVGLTLRHKRGEMSKAVIDGINFGLLDNLISINNLKIVPKEARVIGGGAKSSIWLQMLANTLGIKLHTINTSEGGALGAIILAMVGCGKFKNVELACQKIIKNKNTYVPNIKKHKELKARYIKFKSIYLALKSI